MRVVSLGVSLLLGACNGSAGVSEQPLVIGAIEVPPSDPEGPPAEHLDPLREGISYPISQVAELFRVHSISSTHF